MGLLEGQQVGQALVRRGGGHGQHVRRLHGDGEVVEVPGGVVGQALEQVRADHQRPEGGHQQRVAVGRRALDGRRAHRAAGAALVLHDEAAAQLFLQLRAQRAGDHVGGPAGREGHQQRHRLAGPGLRVGAAGQGEPEAQGERQTEGGHRLVHDLVSRGRPGSCRVLSCAGCATVTRSVCALPVALPGSRVSPYAPRRTCPPRSAPIARAAHRHQHARVQGGFAGPARSEKHQQETACPQS